MKTKISRILGVSLTAVLLVSLMMFAVPTPVSANPGNVAWENVPTPAVNPCRTLGNIGATLGPLEQNSDGTIFYAYDSTGASGFVLFASTNCGRCWAPTTYNFGAVVAIAASPTEPNTVFVANAGGVYRSDNAGATWINVATSPVGGTFVITALDAAMLSAGRYLLTCGAFGAANTAEVYTLDTGGTFPPVWVDTDFNDQIFLDFGANPDSIQAVATTPYNPSETTGFVAIGNDAGTNRSYISVKIGGARWGGDIGQLVAPIAVTAGATPTAAIAFPDGFTLSNCLFYFGISDTAAATNGVYSFWGQPFPLNSFTAPLAVAAANDIVSLDTSGAFGVGLLVAGTQTGGVLRSLDGGANWVPGPAKPPSGTGFTYVMINESASCAGWYALVDDSGSANGGLSFSADNGTSWNQISFVANTIVTINDLAFLADGTILMASTGAAGDDIWRLKAGAWERVFTSTLPGATPFDLVEAVPGSSTTVFLANFGGGAQRLWRSVNAGQIWAQQANNVPLAGTLSSWLIVSDMKQVIGNSTGNVYITNYNGISWGGGIATTLGVAVYSMALDPTDSNRMLAGGATGAVVLSPNGGLAWAPTGATGLGANSAFVAFDASDPTIMYATAAAAGTVVRTTSTTPPTVPWTQIDAQGQDMSTGAGGAEFPVEAASGIASSSLGALYVTDSTAAVTPTDALRARGAMYRALDPQVPVIGVVPQPYWENAYEATPAPTLQASVVTFGVLLGTSNLWLIPDTVPTLWAVDTSGTNGLWTYTDTMAVANSLGAGASGSTTTTTAWDVVATASGAIISWSALAGATNYQLQVNSRTDWNPATFVIPANIINYFPDTQAVVTGLTPATKYYVRVRTAAQAAVGTAPVGIGAPVRSPWSATMSFTTQLGEATPPVPLVPLPGATGVSLTPTFDWDPVPGAVAYDIVVATDEDFTAVVASGSASTDACAWSLLSATPLDYGTQYYWSIQPIGSGGAVAGNPVISIFTTEAAPAAPVYTCGYDGLEFASQALLQAHIDAVHGPAAQATPMYIWVVIAIGAVLVIAVVVLIARTRGAA